MAISLRLGEPLGRSHLTAVLHNTRLELFADKHEQAPVCNPMPQKHQHLFMVDPIKERLDIHIQCPVHLLALERDLQRIQRIVLVTSRP